MLSIIVIKKKEQVATLWLGYQKPAINRDLVEKAVGIIRALDKEPARPDEARELL